jgi:hypothetical protein
VTTAIYTAPWKLMREPPGGLVPVRISIGRPKFIKDSHRFPSIRELMPFDILGMEHDQFKLAYRRHLEHVGVETIHDRFDQLHRRHHDRPLALTCFEDLLKPGTWCHRRMFAAWWQEHTGEDIPELQFTYAPDWAAVEAEPKAELLTLF